MNIQKNFSAATPTKQLYSQQNIQYLHQSDQQSLNKTPVLAKQQSFTQVKMVFKKQITKLLDLKQQLEVIRQRKAVIPIVPDPQIVDEFNKLKILKQREITKKRLQESVQNKKKQLNKLRKQIVQYQKQYQEKKQIFQQKFSMQKILAGKMQLQLTKTKERFRQAQFNKVIICSVRKVLCFRLAQIFLNQQTRAIFKGLNTFLHKSQKVDEENIANALAYLTLFVTITAKISGVRLWIDFVFKGPKSTIRAFDGSNMLLHPRDAKINQAIRLLTEQTYQVIHQTFQNSVVPSLNFYLLCQVLFQEILKAT